MKYAEQCYLKFAKAEGNQHIASIYALQILFNFIEWYKPKRILEIGLGIGSIADSLMNYCKDNNISITYYGTEQNEYCIHQLRKNLRLPFERLHLFSSINALPKDIKYDLIIIDGSDTSLANIQALTSNHGILFIEGDRSSQLEQVRTLFPNHQYVHVISNIRNPNYGPFSSAHWAGGGKVIFTNPNMIQRIHSWYLKIQTAYRYRTIRRKAPMHVK